MALPLVPTDLRVVLQDGTINPVWWRFFQDLKVNLFTVDLATQVTGVLDLANGGTGSAVGPQADTLVDNWVSYGATSTVTGWAATPLTVIRGLSMGSIEFIAFDISGTSNSTGVSFTLPRIAANTGIQFSGTLGYALDNGAILSTAAHYELPANTATVSCMPTMDPTSLWTNANGKRVIGQFWYEAA